MLPRSFLYAPGDRRDLIVKALASPAHAVVIDLEDAVAPAAKESARAIVSELLAGLVPDRHGPQVHVRCNRLDLGWDPRDLDASVHPSVHTLRLAKAEQRDSVVDCASQIADLEAARGDEVGRISLDLLIESALGVLEAPSLATADRVGRLCLGGADLAVDLGVQVELADEDPLRWARQSMVLASRAAGLNGPIDTVSTRVHDDERVRSEAAQARAHGFSGKSAIHPRQLEPIHEAFRPTAEEVAWAMRIVDAWDVAAELHEGGLVVDGEFVDAPVAARAAQVVTDSLTPPAHRRGAP